MYEGGSKSNATTSILSLCSLVETIKPQNQLATTFKNILKQLSKKYVSCNCGGGHIQERCHTDPFQDVHGLVRGHVGVVLHVLGLRVVALSYGKGMRPQKPVGKVVEACNLIKSRVSQEKPAFSLLQFYVVFSEKPTMVLIFNRKFQYIKTQRMQIKDTCLNAKSLIFQRGTLHFQARGKTASILRLSHLILKAPRNRNIFFSQNIHKQTRIIL